MNFTKKPEQKINHLNSDDCLLLFDAYVEQGLGVNVAVDQVCESLLDQASRNSLDKSTIKSFEGVYWEAQEIFLAFRKKLYQTRVVYVSKYHLMALIKKLALFLYMTLKNNRFAPIRDYERW